MGFVLRSIFFACLLSNYTYGQCWKEVETGRFFTLGLKDNGTLWFWGDTLFRTDITNYNSKFSAPIQIGAGATWKSISCADLHCLALKDDGTIWALGGNSQGQLSAVFSTMQELK